jgi:hypothetical protein
VRAAAACALAGRLVAEPARDPGLVSECREFLIELRSRDEYDSVERFLELLEPSSGDASESS